MVHNVKLGKNMRSVSIVGIGATPFFNGVQNETYKGLTNGELFGHAALDAMKDAGVEPRDVQYFFHGSANPHVLNNCITPNLQVADWFGMMEEIRDAIDHDCYKEYKTQKIAAVTGKNE